MNNPAGHPAPAVGFSAITEIDDIAYAPQRGMTAAALSGEEEGTTVVYDPVQFATWMSALGVAASASNRHAQASEVLAQNAGAQAAEMGKQAAAMARHADQVTQLVAIMRNETGGVSTETPLQMHVRYVECLAGNSDITDKLQAKAATAAGPGASIEVQIGDMAAALVADTLRRYPSQAPSPSPSPSQPPVAGDPAKPTPLPPIASA